MTVENAFNKFIRSRKLNGLSNKSIVAYESFVGYFVNFIGGNNDLYSLTQDDLENYIEYQVNRDISKNTFSTYIRHFKIFVRWVCDNYDVSFTYKSIKVPKSAKKIVRVYSELEIKQIFDTIQHPLEWIGYRDRAIISFMLDSGIRQEEVCSLKSVNVLCEFNRMIVRGKGDKERVVPLGRYSVALYKEYLSACPYESDMAFVTKTGSSLKTNTIKLMVSKLGKKLPFEISSHKLRHNFATNYCLDMYYKNGSIDIYRLMVIMGHEDVSTTRRYLHLANEIISSSECLSHLDGIYINKQ